MAKVFLDTNYFIDALHRKPEQDILHSLVDNTLYASPLSFHIYCYVYKIKIPNEEIMTQMEKIHVVDFSQNILERALEGPTADLEDNVQLHSATAAGCDVFLTHDKHILDLTFFGTMRLARTPNR